MTQRQRPCENSDGTTIYKSKREASEETNPADTLISYLQLPELRENNFCWLSPPICGTLLPQPQQTNTVPSAETSPFSSEFLLLFWSLSLSTLCDNCACTGVSSLSFQTIELCAQGPSLIHFTLPTLYALIHQIIIGCLL